MTRIVACLLIATACAPLPELDDTCFETDASVELGTGWQGFEALDETDTIDVVHGPQGGYHVYYSVRPDAMAPIADLSIEVTDLETNRLLTVGVDPVRLAETEGRCTLEAVGLLAILDIDDSADIEGHAGLIDIEIIDEEGRFATDSVTVVFRADR